MEAALAHQEEPKKKVTRGGAAVARRAHNPKVAGSNPAPASDLSPGQMEMPFDGEVAPPTITQEQLAEMEAVLQGKRGPIPGTYDPDGEYRTESPPWMA